MNLARRRRNSDINLEKQKIVFQFFLVTVSAFIGGLLFTKLLSGEKIAELSLSVVEHFNFKVDLHILLSATLKQSIIDIVCILLIFLFSFSYFNYLATDLILAFLGFRTGINISLCFFSFIGKFLLFTSLLFKVFLLLILAIYSCKAAIFSLKLKRTLPNGRVTIDSKILISLTILTTSTIGVSIIINGLYCLI